jgi:phage terminase Nu1 subunit (DNA packaging protein)
MWNRHEGIGDVIPFRPRGRTEPWVTKAQLAQHVQVSAKTVERWVADGMPCLRSRRTVRFQISACEAWLGAGS